MHEADPRASVRALPILLLAALLAGCVAQPTAPQGDTAQHAIAGTATIHIQNSAYHPDEIYVKKGALLRFQNDDAVLHAPQTAAWTLQTPPGSASEVTADQVGDFQVACAYHGIPVPLRLHVVA